MTRACSLLLALLLPALAQAQEEWVYVSATLDSKVSVWAVGPQGKLSLRSELALPERPAAMALSPDRKRIYVAGVRVVRKARADGKKGRRERQNWIVTLERGARGALEVAGRQRVPDRYAYLRVAPDGRFLLTAAYGRGSVSVFPLVKGLCGARVQELTTERTAHCVEFDPSGKFVFVPHTAPNKVYQLRYDARSGRLSPNVPASVSGPADDKRVHQPRHVRFHPRLPLAYTSNERGGGISRWSLDPKTGTLTLQQTLSTLPPKYQGESAAAEVRLTPDGRFAFVSNRDKDKRGRDTLAAFALDAQGALSAVGTFPAPAFPRAFTVGGGGKRLYVAGQHTRHLVVYAVDAKLGSLRESQRLDVGKGPAWVLSVLDR